MQSQEPREKPASVPIQSVTLQQIPSVQAGTTNVIHVQMKTINNAAIAGFVLGLIGAGTTMFAVVLDEFDLCLFAWLPALLAIIFGHIGANKASKTGVGRISAITGYVLGYVILSLYIVAIVFLLLLLRDLGF